MLKLLLTYAPRLGLAAVAGPAGAVVTAGATVFQAAVAFFSTTLGRYVAAALIGLALFVAGDVRRGHQDSARYAAMVASSEAKAKERDARIAKSISDDADVRIASIQSAAAQMQEKIDAYEKALANSAVCRLLPSDIGKLRNLR